jgi:hypothetical protein
MAFSYPVLTLSRLMLVCITTSDLEDKLTDRDLDCSEMYKSAYTTHQMARSRAMMLSLSASKPLGLALEES